MYSFIFVFQHSVFWDSSSLLLSTVHSPTGEHLDCFQAGAIMSIGVEIFFLSLCSPGALPPTLHWKCSYQGHQRGVHVDNSSDQFSALILLELPEVVGAEDHALGLPHSLPPWPLFSSLCWRLLTTLLFTCCHLSPEISFLPIFLPIFPPLVISSSLNILNT